MIKSTGFKKFHATSQLNDSGEDLNVKISSVSLGFLTKEGEIITGDVMEIKEHGFSKLEIEFMKQTIEKQNFFHEIWKPAFEYYNAYHSPKLHMGCVPCYTEVLNFIIRQQ